MRIKSILICIIIWLIQSPDFHAQEHCWREHIKLYPNNDVNRGLYSQSEPSSLFSAVHQFAKDTVHSEGAIQGVDQALHDATYKVGALNLYQHPDFVIIPRTSNHPLIDMYGDDSINSDGLVVYPYVNIEYLANQECEIEVTEYYDFPNNIWKIKEIAFYYFFGNQLQKQPTLTINWEKFAVFCKKEGLASNWFENNRLNYEVIFKAPCDDVFSSNTISALTIKNPPYLSIRSSHIAAEKVAHLFEGGDDLIYSMYDLVSNNELMVYPEPNNYDGIYVEHFQRGLYSEDPVLKYYQLYFYRYLGEEADTPMRDIKNQDSIDHQGNYIYPPRDTLYFKEKHIEQFRVTELGMYNPETNEINYKPLMWSIVCKNENDSYNAPHWININSFFMKLIKEHPSLDHWKSIVQKTIDEGHVYQLWEIKQR
jgi:hypothetical protein